MALTTHALGQPGLRARPGTSSVFEVLSRIYERARLDRETHAQHGFVQLAVAGLPPFMIDGDMIVVRNPEGRMKAVHSYSMRAYIEAARRDRAK